MKIIKPEFYKDFKCIAGECPDSCCQGWEVDADSESLEFYKTLSDELDIKKKIDSVLDKDEFGNTIFTLAPKKRCPFLNDENLCDMHIAIGGEHTPYTCRTFPRFIYDFGGTREIGLSFSCPVAADMMYNYNKKWEFEEEFNDEPPSLNEIDARWYFALHKSRRKIIDTLFDNDVEIKEKIHIIIDVVNSLCSDFETVDEKLIDDIDFFDVFKNPELINPEWEDRVNNHKVKPVENSKANVNICAYFIYKYFMQAAFDYDVLSKLKMMIIGVLINTYFGGDAWGVHLWSKETEHSQYNMDRYKRLLREAKCLSLKKLIERINADV